MNFWKFVSKDPVGIYMSMMLLLIFGLAICTTVQSCAEVLQ